jgi:hypothetical protein
MEAADILHNFCTRNNLDMELLGSLSLDSNISCLLLWGRHCWMRSRKEEEKEGQTIFVETMAQMRYK